VKELFVKKTINDLILTNMFVRSATWEGMCEADGRPTPKLASCYRDLASGGVGLIITGYAFVRPDGKQLPGKMGIHTDYFAAEMSSLARTVHHEGVGASRSHLFLSGILKRTLSIFARYTSVKLDALRQDFL
jgi:2,4-dienoyl-CoA reductase-like NADH-dependent reductase (Old Yellow Enzyme family)